MAEKRSKRRLNEGSSECQAKTREDERRVVRAGETREKTMRSDDKRREKQKGSQRKTEDEGSRGFKSCSQLQVEEAVNELIDSAWSAAEFTRGEAKLTSQMFHSTVRKKIEGFLGACSEGCKLADLGPVVHDILVVLEGNVQCKLRPTAGKNSVFPLPAPEMSGAAGTGLEFLHAVIRGLNSMHGVTDFSNDSAISRRVVKKLQEMVEGSELLQEKLPEINFPTFLKSKSIDYQGEEVHVAKKVAWKSVSLSLPDQVGTLDIREFCEGGVLHYVTHFEDFLIPECDQFIGKCPSVMVDKDEWEHVATGLVEKGLCQVLPVSDLHHVHQRPLLNGLFSVRKQEVVDNVEVTRLIMNLKPANLICRALEGDTGTLPAVSQMGGIYLADGEVLSASSEDIRCFFYLFRVPRSWIRFLAFGREAPEKLIPESQRGTPHYLCALVLPMGFVNSVGIAQHIHRNVCRRALGSLRPPIGGHQEMRRDKVFSGHANLFRIYLDNFDQLKRLDRATACLLEGTPSSEVEVLREAYCKVGLPRHPKKSVCQQMKAEVQGA